MKKIILIGLITIVIVIVSLIVYLFSIKKPTITKEYIEQRISQLREIYQEKLDQGYGLTEVLNYGKQALEAFEQGDYKLADKLLNLASEALERAKIPPQPIKQCPLCPLPNQWSECKDQKQTRTNYKCSAETNYECQSYKEERSCGEEIPKTYPGGIKAVSMEDEYKHDVPEWGELWAPVFLFKHPETGKIWKWGDNFENPRIESISRIDSQTLRIYGQGIEFIFKSDGYRKITIDSNILKSDWSNHPGWLIAKPGDVVEFYPFNPKAVFWQNRGQPLSSVYNVMHYQSLGNVTLKRGGKTYTGIGSFQRVWLDKNFYDVASILKREDAFHIFTDKFVFFIQGAIYGENEIRDGMVYWLDDGSYDVLGETVNGYPYQINDGLNRLSFHILAESHKGKIEISLSDPTDSTPVPEGDPSEPWSGFQQAHWNNVQVTLDGKPVRGIAATSETIRKSKVVTDKYEQLLCTGAKYNPNLTEVRGSGWFPYGLKPESEIDLDFQHAKNLGLNTIRFSPFYQIPEDFDPPLSLDPVDSRIINYTDLVISKAKKYNLKLIPVLLSDTVVPVPMLNHDIDDLKAWVGGIITKYKDEPTIYAWDVVNEPIVYSMPDHLSKTLALIDYAKTLDPDTPVTSGEGEQKWEVRNALDIISLHWYPFGKLSKGESPYSDLISLINNVKTLNKPIILQEFDLPTTPPYSEKLQECFLFKVLDIIKSSGIKGYVWLNLKDYTPIEIIEIPGASRKSGLIRSDYSYKPATKALP